MTYRVDQRDITFQLFEWLPLGEILAAERFADWDEESLRMALDEALKIAQESLDPANEEGNTRGSRWQDGEVTVPASFHDAYRTLKEGGWVGAVNSPELGGLGMPQTVGAAASEFFNGSNLGLSVSVLLTRGAGELIEHYGSAELRQLYCEKLYTGEWMGTMCLTEPQAGSDVGASTSRAVPQDDGSYLISGEKIFITYGDHDLADNIVHAVLARLPDAPAGAKGLSLFAVPKIRVADDGSLGEPNDVRCAGIEHKLGIHGSPTCSILFGGDGGCRGHLIGEAGQGLKLMFQMMNAARLEVGVQGMAVGAAAQQAAVAFAHERVQGRHWAAGRDDSSVAIIEHPDVRRILWTSNAYVQAMRSLLLKTYWYVDMAAAGEGEERTRYQSLVDLMTPICKAWGSDWGCRVADWCLQAYGGYGYTTDYPAEQYLRDARITPIYEGTNGIQALDLVFRKLPARGGEALRQVLGEAGRAAQRAKTDAELSGAADQLFGALSEVQQLLSAFPGRADAPLSLSLNAVPILDMLGHVVAGGHLLDQACLAQEKLSRWRADKGIGDAADSYRAALADDPDAVCYHNKVQAAITFAYRALPRVKSLATAIRAGETAAIDAVL